MNTAGETHADTDSLSQWLWVWLSPPHGGWLARDWLTSHLVTNYYYYY